MWASETATAPLLPITPSRPVPAAATRAADVCWQGSWHRAEAKPSGDGERTFDVRWRSRGKLLSSVHTEAEVKFVDGAA